MQNNFVLIFLTTKATTLDTHMVENINLFFNYVLVFMPTKSNKVEMQITIKSSDINNIKKVHKHCTSQLGNNFKPQISINLVHLLRAKGI